MPLTLWILLALCFLFILGTGGCYLWISRISAPYLFDKAAGLPHRETALLLGTAKFTRHGQLNSFFTRRIAKAVEVYRLGKTKHFIISGANRHPAPEDEVDFMEQSLLSEKISYELLIKDHKGSRTWNSLWRCKHIYHVTDPVIISQRFHNQRAIFIGLKMGMHPIAVNAAKVGGRVAIRMFLRECLARVKCILDCYLLRPVPH